MRSKWEKYKIATGFREITLKQLLVGAAVAHMKKTLTAFAKNMATRDNNLQYHFGSDF